MAVDRVSDRELVVSRTFDAPARIVYEAWTKPEHMKRWWAPKSFGAIMYECDNDLRTGGTYRFVFGKEGQPKMAFSGVYKEVVPNGKLVATQVFEQMPHAGEAIVTTTFVETDGKTRVELRQLFPSKQALDGAIATGMTDGMRITFGQLDELCRELSAP
ncbi:MAG TPA: SRPBCC family protein [Kofleriaceae bacterium]